MHLPPLSKRVRTAGVAGLTVAFVAACGGSPDDGNGNAGGDSVGAPLKVVTQQVGEFLLPYLAQERGLFEQEGVDVEIVPFTGSTQVQIPKLLKGDFDVSSGGAADMLPSIVEGLPLTVLADVGTVLIGDKDQDPNVYIAKDPSITEACDVEGKSVGMQSVGGQQELSFRATLELNGCDDSTVEIVQMPVQNIPAAIDRGQLDVGQGYEPYLTMALEMGQHTVFTGNEATAGLPGLTFLVTESTANGRQADVDAFARAMQQAIILVQEDPELLRNLVLEHTETDPELVRKMTRFGLWSTDIGPEKFQELMEFAAENGQIENTVPAEDWVYVPDANT